jgi:N6-adenosine-specific RNA methylase IME4
VKYRTIVADPPWEVHQGPSHGVAGGTSGNRNRTLPYATMSVERIASLEVASLADTDAHLYLWTINRYVEDTYRVVRCWGFEPSTLLTWCKPLKGLGPGGAYALTSEFCLFARRGKGAFESRHPTTWFQWPRGAHSAKPEAFLDIVERVSPGPYLEMFARRARFGWDYWGDESLGSAEVAA